MSAPMRVVRFDSLIQAGILEIGDGYRAKNSELGAGGPIFLRASHVHDNIIDMAGAEQFEATAWTRVAGKLGKVGDTVVTTKGASVGRTAFVSEGLPPFVYSPHLSYWRSLDPARLAPGFLHYWARGPEFRAQLDGMKQSTDMAPYLSLRDQRRLRISLPVPNQQHGIAEILGALDDKIHLNREKNLTCEALIGAIFKSWFVDFDPVLAKAEGRQPTGLAPEIAALFPDRFTQSGSGEIPDGWEVAALGDLCDFVSGRSYASRDLKSSPVALVTLKSFQRGGGYRTDGLKPYTGPYGAHQVVEAGEIIVARTDVTQAAEVIGRAARVLPNKEFERLVASLDVLIVRPKGAMTREYLYYLLGSPDYVNHAVAHTNGTTVLHLDAAALPSYRFPMPPQGLIQRFSEVAAATWERIVLNEQESQALAALRDLLLPKLLSGEIRIRDAEKLAVEAGA